MTPNRLLPLALMAAAPLASTAALASTAQPERIEVVARSEARIARADVAPMLGSYDLSDGRLLVVAARGARVVASIDQGPDLRLQLASPNRLVSADGTMALEFQATPNGSVHGVKLVASR